MTGSTMGASTEGRSQRGSHEAQALQAGELSWEDVVSEASRKRAERGGFDNRIFLKY